MKVALIYLDALGSGGYPRDIRWLAGSLAGRGLRVLLVARQGPEKDGLTSVELVAPEEFGGRAEEVDVIHICGLFLPAQLRFAWLLPKNAVTVISPLAHLMEHHVRYKNWKKTPYLAFVRGAAARWKHHAHLFSKAEQNGAEKYLKAESYFEASLGVFPAPAEPLRGNGWPDDYLLFLGRNDVYQKGIDVLVAGYAIARGRGLRLPLVIAGASHQDSELALRRTISGYDLNGSVCVAGGVSEEEKWNLLTHARCLVFLSRWDGPPRPIREALAVGTPAIVSPETNLGDLVESAEAGMCTRLDPQVVAGALLRSQDDSTVEQWGRGAVRLRESLAWERVADQYVEGYRSAVATEGGP